MEHQPAASDEQDVIVALQVGGQASLDDVIFATSLS